MKSTFRNGTILRSSWIQKITLSLGVLLLTAGPKPAAGEVSEYAVKAAYLYNFTQFVRWSRGAAG